MSSTKWRPFCLGLNELKALDTYLWIKIKILLETFIVESRVLQMYLFFVKMSWKVISAMYVPPLIKW